MARKNRDEETAMSVHRMRSHQKSQRKKADASLYDAQTEEYYRSFFSEIVEQEVADGRPPEGDRWSIWDQSEPLEKGPEPRPSWLVTELAAVDYELGVLKTGKEADVFLIQRAVPGEPGCLLASKRYRSAHHSHFNRSEDYVAGRGIKSSRQARAIKKGTSFGKLVSSGRWSVAEFDALKLLWQAGVSVPYPVQVFGTEVIMEFIGDDNGEAAPRLEQLRPDPVELKSLWEQLTDDMVTIVREGYTHGDLSAYNSCVWEGRLYLFDLPQIVDLYLNPKGQEFLRRDVVNIGRWFTDRGMAPEKVDGLMATVMIEAGFN
ncbi:serine protein kinase RIO [Natronoglycomyces albus]|uniref:non-specific serine/threonine protein kinase n=1 Tax=Natronoglycomyces albus TaxID=2811108 RepID=A0A895XKC0_9ACTN|nr:RIO1 family regulatory kinase/ATPase [Natronoglycomyces albus]QSB03879.1 RIO-like kinase [Natronoglycomyces albus]